MANVRKVPRKKGPGYAWEVRWRDPQREDCSATFRTKAEAEKYGVTIEADIARGTYIDPKLGKKAFGA